MRYLVSAAATIALAASALANPSPAHAEAGSFSSPNVIFFESCDDYPFLYDLGVPDYAESWDAQIAVLGPDGKEAGSAYAYGSGAAAGRDSVQICSGMPGRYRFEAHVTWYDYDYNEQTFDVSNGSFLARLPKTRTKIAGSVARRVNVTTSVKDERPRGYFPTDFVEVLLQVKRGARWVTVDKSYTSEQGKARLSTRNAPGRQSFRVRTRPQSYVNAASSVSRTVRL